MAGSLVGEGRNFVEVDHSLVEVEDHSPVVADLHSIVVGELRSLMVEVDNRAAGPGQESKTL